MLAFDEASDMPPGFPFEQARAEARAAYTAALDRLIDETMQGFVQPADRETILVDMVQFAVFVATSKLTATRGERQDDRRAQHAAYRTLFNALDRDVPTMVNHLVDAERAGDGA